jgi:hypothetical protein
MCGRREGAVERGEILMVQAHVERAAVLTDVIRSAGFGNGDYARLTQHPRQGHLGRGRAVVGGDGTDRRRSAPGCSSHQAVRRE